VKYFDLVVATESNFRGCSATSALSEWLDWTWKQLFSQYAKCMKRCCQMFQVS